MEDLLSDVLVEPKIAKKRSRVAAVIIDTLILFLIGCIYGYFFGNPDDDSTIQFHCYIGSVGFRVAGLRAVIWYMIVVCLIPLQEGLTGKTLGKRIIGIRVVKDDYSPATVVNTIVRHLFDFVDVFLLAGLIVAACNWKNKRIGDFVAQTVVVEG